METLWGKVFKSLLLKHHYNKGLFRTVPRKIIPLYQASIIYPYPNRKHSQTTKSCYIKNKICLSLGRKHCGKRRKCWLPAFSPFPHNVFKNLFPQGRQNSIRGKGLTSFTICFQEINLTFYYPACFQPNPICF